MKKAKPEFGDLYFSDLMSRAQKRAKLPSGAWLGMPVMDIVKFLEAIAKEAFAVGQAQAKPTPVASSCLRCGDRCDGGGPCEACASAELAPPVAEAEGRTLLVVECERMPGAPDEESYFLDAFFDAVDAEQRLQQLTEDYYEAEGSEDGRPTLTRWVHEAAIAAAREEGRREGLALLRAPLLDALGCGPGVSDSDLVRDVLLRFAWVDELLALETVLRAEVEALRSGEFVRAITAERNAYREALEKVVALMAPAQVWEPWAAKEVAKAALAAKGVG